MERSTIFHGKIHYKWPFSIVMLVYQRVPQLDESIGRPQLDEWILMVLMGIPQLDGWNNPD
jgi:hypothetical protein